MAVSTFIICTESHFENGIQICDATELLDGVILPPSGDAQLSLLMDGGFSVDAAGQGFIGIMSLWVAGVTVGLIISLIRKVRS
jgi:hypothetical protein